MNQTIILSPETMDLEVEQTVIVQRANSLIVSTMEEHGIALEMLKSVAVASKRVQELFKEPKAAAFTAHRSISEAEGKLLKPLAEARAIISQKATTYEIEEQRKAEEEARRAQEEARKAEEQRQIEDAVLAEANGDQAAGDAILEAPIEIPTIKPAPLISRMAGITSRTTYKGEVVDLLTLVKYVAANPHEIALLEINQTALNSRAKSMREGFKLPGCRLVKEVGKAVKVG